MLIRTKFYFNLIKMFQKNQQLSDLVDQVNIQQLLGLDIAQSYLIKLLITLNKLKSDYSNLFDLVKTAVISHFILIIELFFKNILLIQLIIKYFTPFVINLILHISTAIAASARAIHSKANLCKIQLTQKYRVRADALMTRKFKTIFEV